MCGSAGLFLGCGAAAWCPKRELRRDEPATPGAVGYRGLTQWEQRAQVRTGRLSTMEPWEWDERLPLSLDLVPGGHHELVRALDRGSQRELALRHLARYLHATTVLETRVVNRTTLGIAQGSVGVALPDQMRMDAYRIYCDEGFHALAAAELLRSLGERAERDVLPTAPPYFMSRLERMLEEDGGRYRALTELLFVVVSETLISSTLAQASEGTDTAPSVSRTMRDHAADEGRHHAYFTVFFRELWAGLDPAERRHAQRAAPRLIDIFLTPNRDDVRDDLHTVGLLQDQVEEVLDATFDPRRLADSQRVMARHTLALFDEVVGGDLATVLVEDGTLT